MFTDAYARLLAMKLFGDRAVDYFRCADEDDRRYLLYNPITKMKVTTEGGTMSHRPMAASSWLNIFEA